MKFPFTALTCKKLYPLKLKIKQAIWNIHVGNDKLYLNHEIGFVIS